MPASIHLTSLTQKVPIFTNTFGAIARIDAADMPILKRLSMRRLVLAPRSVREPHWHANAHELGYCLKGRHLVTIAGSHSTRDSFTISPGQILIQTLSRAFEKEPLPFGFLWIYKQACVLSILDPERESPER